MPARLFEHALPPQRIRTYLILFGIALTLPLLGIALFAFHQLTSLEEQELERRVRQVALDMAGDIDREIDRATVALEILATSPLLAQDNSGAPYFCAGRMSKGPSFVQCSCRMRKMDCSAGFSIGL